jgi:hypothetical protein
MIVKFGSYEIVVTLKTRPHISRSELTHRAKIKSDNIELPRNVKRLLSAYFPELDLDEIRIKQGIPWYVPMKADAFTDRNLIYFERGRYRPASLAGIALIAHELAHCAQYKRHGTWRFRIMYAREWLVELFRHSSFTKAYFENRFEVEARVMEDMVYDDLSNQLS